jgi:hypothetical protein
MKRSSRNSWSEGVSPFQRKAMTRWRLRGPPFTEEVSFLIPTNSQNELTCYDQEVLEKYVVIKKRGFHPLRVPPVVCSCTGTDDETNVASLAAVRGGDILNVVSCFLGIEDCSRRGCQGYEGRYSWRLRGYSISYVVIRHRIGI